MGLFDRPSLVSYPVRDWQQAKRFYGETLGMPVAGYIDDATGWMEFGVKDGPRLAISLWRGPDAVPPKEGGATVIFEVPDALAAAQELKKKGVRVDEVESIPGMVSWANFYDPEGNRLQIAGPGPQAGS